MNNLTIASEYFESVVSKIHLTYLRKYSILQQADAYSYRLHQIVLDAIKYVHQQPNKPVFAEKLIAYLDVKNRLKDIQFFTLFHCNGDYVEKVYQDSNTSDAQKKVILYSQLQAENTFSDSEKFIEKLNKLVLNPVDSLYDCLLLVEKNEIELSATEKDKIEEQAKVMIANMNDVMKQTTNIEIRFELLHHIGKLYIKMRDLDNAKVYFNQALDIRPKAYATLLQLAKAFQSSRPSDTKKAKEYVTLIMDDFGEGVSVPLTILLACYSVFLSKKDYHDLARKYIEDRFDDFSKVIIDSLMTFPNQAVPTLGALAFYLAYENPDFMRFALQALQEPPSIHSDRAYIQAYANLKAAEYKLEEDKNTDKAKAILASAKEYYGLLKLEENEGKYPKDYIRKRYLELLMDAGELEEALQFSKYFDDKESPFYLQDMTKLYHKLEEYDKALDYIDKAIAGIADTGFKSSFMWNKANILHDMGDSSCMTLLQEAIDMREADKAKGEWKKTIEVWASEF